MNFIEINQDFGAGSEYLYIFVATISIVWLALVIYSLKKHGIKKTIRYFLPMMVAALVIESVGLATGRYHYPGYFIYLTTAGGMVPFLLLMGWSANLYLVLHIGELVVSKLYQRYNLYQVILISAFSGLFGTCLDLLEDPVAHHNSWWVWTESMAGITFFDVPVLNFPDFFIIIFYMSLATLLIERSGFSENRKLVISFSSLPIVGAAMILTHTLLIGIFNF